MEVRLHPFRKIPLALHPSVIRTYFWKIDLAFARDSRFFMIMKEFNNSDQLERTVVLQLNREHEHHCRIHKVRLRPIAIILFDSDTRWGLFDDRARTISLSRRLINDFPWHSVVGVLLHEMAHQLVAEQRPAAFATERPHNEAFQEACRRLGVPEQFAKAGVDLKSCTLDWRTEPRDEAVEKILERVKKLLALASSNNEHEALLAMERVRDLYAKYNLEQIQNLSNDRFVHLVISNGKKRSQSWERRTVSILCEHFFVKALFFRQFEPKTGEHVHAVEIIGTRENVLMAEYVYHFLLNQIEALLNARDAKKISGPMRKSFRLGILDGFAQKLKAAEKAPPAGLFKMSKGLTIVGEALQRFHNDKKISAYIDLIYPRTSSRSGPGVSIDQHAFSAGQAAGRSINLNKPIISRDGNLGRLLK